MLAPTISDDVSSVTKSQMIWRVDGFWAGKPAVKWSANSRSMDHGSDGGPVRPANLFTRTELGRGQDYGALSLGSHLDVKVRRGFGEAPRVQPSS